MAGPLSGSMLYQYIARSPSAVCFHLFFPYSERGNWLFVVDSAGAPGWPMCSCSQVDVLQQCRQNPGLLWCDWFQEKSYILPASTWYIESILGHWHYFDAQKWERTWGGFKVAIYKEECLSSYFPSLFLFCFYLADPSAFYPGSDFYQLMTWQFNSIECATYEHSSRIELLLFLIRFQQNPLTWLHEYNISKWWIKSPSVKAHYTLCFSCT